MTTINFKYHGEKSILLQSFWLYKTLYKNNDVEVLGETDHRPFVNFLIKVGVNFNYNPIIGMGNKIIGWKFFII